MAKARDIVLLGTGAFAGAFARALARQASGPATVHVVSRSLDRARHLAHLADAHALLADRPTRFRPHLLDVPDGADLRPLLDCYRPQVLLVAASEISPAETRAPASAWTSLVRAAGFGVTLPLQAATALRAATACLEASPGTAVVNACFPDAVNPLLQTAGLPVVCGLGNVATLASLLRSKLQLADESRLKLFAHHVHLHHPRTDKEEALAWLDDQPLTALPRALDQIREQPHGNLNEIGAIAGAAVVDALTQRREPYVGHVPAPNGLPGGYPVLITEGSIALRLPPGMSERQAVHHNRQWSAGDGLTVDGHGKARFTPTALRALSEHWPDIPSTFGIQDIDDLRVGQLALRERLRHLPTPTASGNKS
jgi:hypothetical protein